MKKITLLVALLLLTLSVATDANATIDIRTYKSLKNNEFKTVDLISCGVDGIGTCSGQWFAAKQSNCTGTLAESSRLHSLTGSMTSPDRPFNGSTVTCGGNAAIVDRVGKVKLMCNDVYMFDMARPEQNPAVGSGKKLPIGDVCNDKRPENEKEVKCVRFPLTKNVPDDFRDEQKQCCSDTIKGVGEAPPPPSDTKGIVKASLADAVASLFPAYVTKFDQCCTGGRSCCKSYWNPISIPVPNANTEGVITFVYQGVSYTTTFPVILTIVNGLAGKGHEFCAFKNKQTKFGWLNTLRLTDPEAICDGTLQTDLSRLLSRIPLVGGIIKWPFKVIGGSYYYKPCAGGSSSQNTSASKLMANVSALGTTNGVSFELNGSDTSKCSAKVLVDGEYQGFMVYAKNSYFFMDAPIDQPQSVYSAIDTVPGFTAQSRVTAKLAISDSIFTPSKVSWYWNGTTFVKAFVADNVALTNLLQGQYLSTLGIDASKCVSNAVPARFQTFLNSAPQLKQCTFPVYGDTNKDGKMDGEDLACFARKIRGEGCSADSRLLDLDNDGQTSLTDLVYELDIIANPDKLISYSWSADYDRSDIWRSNIQSCLNMVDPTKKANLFAPAIIEPTYAPSCGDGICSDSEIGSCSADCGKLDPGAPQPVVTIAESPDAVIPGKSAMISWSSENYDGKITFKLWKGRDVVGSVPDLPATGSHTFTIPESFPRGNDYQIMLEGTNGIIYATSSKFSFGSTSNVPLFITSTTTTVYRGQSATLTWVSNGLDRNDSINLRLLKDGSPLGSRTIPNTGSYTLPIPAEIPLGSGYTIDLTAVSGFRSDPSMPFSVVAALPQSITITSSLSQVNTGQAVNISWKSSGISGTITFKLLKGSTVAGTVPNLPLTGSYSFTVPSNLPAGSDYRIRLEGGSASVESSPFSIVAGQDTMFMIQASTGPGGTIMPAGNVQVVQGANANFMIVPNGGYKINMIAVDGKLVGVGPGGPMPFTLPNVTQNHTISVSFKPGYAASTEQGQPSKSLSITYPTASTKAGKGKDFTLTWSSTGLTSGSTLTMTFYKGSQVVGSVPNIPSSDGAYKFPMPTYLPDASDYFIKLEGDGLTTQSPNFTVTSVATSFLSGWLGANVFSIPFPLGN